MMSFRDTGFTTTDAEQDFNRARRRRVLSRLANRLRREPSDVDVILPFEEVVAALGRTGERSLGLRTIPLDSIVGTVDRSKDFDRSFRPTSRRLRGRWEQMAAEARRGKDFPPISVFRIGELHFVRDGHHRVSVYRALGRTHIDAYVTEVTTRLGADTQITLADLPMKGHERLFDERVPLPPEMRRQIEVSDPMDYGCLSEGVEAWAFRLMQACGSLMTREEVAEAWFRDDYLPVVTMLRECGLIGEKETDAEAYARVVTERYRLLRTHVWNEEILERLAAKLRDRS
jgi:hypothetical protein